MIKRYYDEVVNGKRKWNKVPSLWINDVKSKLIDNGYTLNDDGSVSLPDSIENE